MRYPMQKCEYIPGGFENMAPLRAASARTLIGKRVRYIMKGDIYTSRGFIRWSEPRIGTLEEVAGRNVRISGNYIWTSDIREICLDNPEQIAAKAI